jgi:hypothetical protein
MADPVSLTVSPTRLTDAQYTAVVEAVRAIADEDWDRLEDVFDAALSELSDDRVRRVLALTIVYLVQLTLGRPSTTEDLSLDRLEVNEKWNAQLGDLDLPTMSAGVALAIGDHSAETDALLREEQLVCTLIAAAVGSKSVSEALKVDREAMFRSLVEFVDERLQDAEA